MPIKVSDYMIKFIARTGVRHVFYLPGGAAMHLVDSLARCPDLEPVAMLHEQAVAIAAQRYAQCRGFGVALVTGGPGGINALTGCVAAYQDSVPCMFISGQVKSGDMSGWRLVRQRGIQEVDIVSMAKHVTKYAVSLLDPNDVLSELPRAYRLATGYRPGPVWLDVPLDIQGSLVEEGDLGGNFSPGPHGPSVPPDLLSAAIRLLNDARRPVLIAGAGIQIAGARNYFRELAAFLGIPVVLTWPAMDLLPDNHPCYAGRGGLLGERSANFAIQNADLILAIGSRLDFTQTGFCQKEFGPKARKVIVDIDPHELGKFSFDGFPIQADARLFIEALLARRAEIRDVDRRDWLSTVAGWRKRYPIILPEYLTTSGLVNPYHLVDLLSRKATADDIIAPGCAGMAAEYCFQGWCIKDGQRFVTNHGLGPMGFDLPGAIAASLANGNARTICVTGDGGVQLNVQELATLRRLGLPVKIFVMNNGGYSSIRTMQDAHFSGTHLGCDAESGLDLPMIDKVAAAYEIDNWLVWDTRELEHVVDEVLASEGPALCDVLVIPDFKVAPKVMSIKQADGSMVSGRLEDQWPFLDRAELAAIMAASGGES